MSAGALKKGLERVQAAGERGPGWWVVGGGGKCQGEGAGVGRSKKEPLPGGVCLRKHGTRVKERASEISWGSPERLYAKRVPRAGEGGPGRGTERAVEPARSESGACCCPHGWRTWRFQKSRLRRAAPVLRDVRGDRERSRRVHGRTPRVGKSAPTMGAGRTWRAGLGEAGSGL